MSLTLLMRSALGAALALAAASPALAQGAKPAPRPAAPPAAPAQAAPNVAPQPASPPMPQPGMMAPMPPCCQPGIMAPMPGAACCPHTGMGHPPGMMGMPSCPHPPGMRPHGMHGMPACPHHGMKGPGMACEGDQDQKQGAGCETGCEEGAKDAERDGRHDRKGHRTARSHELRYMTGMGALGMQHLLFTKEKGGQLNDWFGMAYSANYGLQLGAAPASSPWLSGYFGFVPRLGQSFGPVRLDLGVLGGVGGMFRTTSLPSAGPDLLQARFFWAVEPRVELGVKGDRHSIGLVGAYLLTPGMASGELGGLSLGLRLGFKGGK